MHPSRPSPRQVKRRRRVAGSVVVGILLAIAWLALRSTVLAPADRHGATVTHLAVDSKAIGRDLDVGVVVPGGGDEETRPLLVFLHGRGENVDDFVGGGPFEGDEAFFAALARLGPGAPVVAFPEDDGSSYWHDRDTGAWGSYVLDEVIPEVTRQFPVDPGRVAIGGISMGGFGAYDLALHNPGRFCAVGGHSPALWLSGAETAPGAFDDAEDFERHDVIAAVRADSEAFGPIPIWNDAGTEDPFSSAGAALNETLEAAGADLTARTWPGRHERAYWDRHWNAYLRFYADALALYS